jgi:hypothetical protein
MKMEQTKCSETSAYKIQAPGNYPEESINVTEGSVDYVPGDIREVQVGNLSQPFGALQDTSTTTHDIHPHLRIVRTLTYVTELGT